MEGGGRNSQIFCLAWVKRNAAKLVPDQIGLTSEELQEVIGGGNHDTDGHDQWSDVSDEEEEVAEEDNVQTQKKKQASDEDTYDDLKEFDMDNYDDEDDGMSFGVSGLVKFTNNDDDPYLKRKSKPAGKETEEDSEGEAEEKSAVELKPDDNLLVCARCSQHSSLLEVYVYNHESGDFYVHHDIPLMEMPLCLQWIGFDPGAVGEDRGNLLAVGNFNSVIDIWDLDILNTLEPVFSIGQENTKKKRKKSDFEHTDAILDLAWSKSTKDQLASSSADAVVAVWDLELGKATRTFDQHKNKVQTIEWKPESSDCLLSGAFDGRILELDTRSSKCAAEWSLDGEIERVTWNPVDTDCFVASNDSGKVFYLDRRTPGKTLHEWTAHGESVPGLVMTKTMVPGRSSALLYTASSDGCVKLWDLNAEKATLVHERDWKMGMVHCCRGNPDVPSVIAAGGQKDSIRLWDVLKTSEVLQYFGLEESNLEETTADTLDPEGGGGEEDDDVIKYIGGEDYINEERIKRLEKQEKNAKRIGKNNLNREKTPSAVERPAAKDTNTQEGTESGKKKRRRKRKNKANGVEVKPAPKAQIAPAADGLAKKKRKRKKKKIMQASDTPPVVENKENK